MKPNLTTAYNPYEEIEFVHTATHKFCFLLCDDAEGYTSAINTGWLTTEAAMSAARVFLNTLHMDRVFASDLETGELLFEAKYRED